MRSYRAAVVAGLAIFTMIFGSGNLVFPMLLGVQVQNQAYSAIFGWTLTAVLVPLLGWVSFVRFHGSRDDYLGDIGRTGCFLFLSFVFLLCGPFGVVPRCVQVGYGGVFQLMPTFPLWAFSALFLGTAHMLILYPSQLIDRIGKFLTPLKLGGIVALLIVGFYAAPTAPASDLSSWDAFSLGFFYGYQTMDLLSAFITVPVIYMYLRSTLSDDSNSKDLKKLVLVAFGVAASILFVVYAGLINLSASFSHGLSEVDKGSLFVAVIQKATGDYALYFAAFLMVVSCWVTSIVLLNATASYLVDECPVTKNRWSYTSVATVCTVIGYVFSLLGFEFIMQVLADILFWIYPLILVYALYQLSRGLGDN